MYCNYLTWIPWISDQNIDITTAGGGLLPFRLSKHTSVSVCNFSNEDLFIINTALLLSGKNLFKLFQSQLGWKENLVFMYVLNLMVIISGDIETNPGPFWKKEEDPVGNLQTVIDEQADEITDLKDIVEKQSDSISDLKNKIDELTEKSDELKLNSEKNQE